MISRFEDGEPPALRRCEAPIWSMILLAQVRLRRIARLDRTLCRTECETLAVPHLHDAGSSNRY